jgi:hypothetical protein
MSTQTDKVTETKLKHRWLKWLFPVTGLLALIWFLVRVIPKPTRATYPCQRVAAPLASGFVIWLIGLFGSIVFFHKAKRMFRKSRFVVAGMCLVVAVAAVYWSLSMNGQWAGAVESTWYEPGDPPNVPLGKARGINPGRVVWAYNPDATSWDGTTGYWWQPENTSYAVVSDMMDDAICDLVGGDVSVTEAWGELFKSFNQRRGKGSVGYVTGEKIAIKIIGRGGRETDHHLDTNNCFAAPQVAVALLEQLEAAGVDDDYITFYDATTQAPDMLYLPCIAEFPDVHFVEVTGGDGREQYVRDTNAQVHWSDDLQDPTEMDGGNDTFLPTCASQADYIINLGNLKAHLLAGITVCAKNHFGSISATRSDGAPGGAPKGAGVHPYIAVHDFNIGNPDWECYKRPMGTYNALVDLMSHKELGEKTLLFLVDGLYAVNYQACWVSNDTKWVSEPFNDDWTSSIFVSQDGVAIESVALDFLRNEPAIQIQSDREVLGAGDTVDNYLHEAALADAPPSGTLYDPEGDGFGPPSLGTHEHWNDPLKRQYTGNLKTAAGIELVRSPMIKGDITGAGVDAEDLAIIALFWLDDDCDLEGNGWCSGADINHDTKVNMKDVSILSGDWSKNIIE